ncbi:MAG: hypothetical protein Kow006_26090 [Gammaproteobacteria bacterium]
MAEPVEKENSHSCALRCEPVFDSKLQRVATCLELMPLDSHPATFSEGFRQLLDHDIGRLLGKDICIVRVPAHEAPAVLDLPWDTHRCLFFVDAESEDIESVCNKVRDKGLRLAVSLEASDQAPFEGLSISVVVTAPENRQRAAVPRDANLWVRPVDSRAVFADIEGQGGDPWVSGRFWKMPNIQPGHTVPASRLGAMKLLADLQDPNVTIEEVEKIINCDSTLSYKLLRLLNSAFFSSPGRVDSIRNGVNFFGLQRIRNWATVIVMNSVDFLPRDILPLGAFRARLAEMIAQAMGRDHPQDYYLAGLFSVLDAMFDVPMKELVTPLHLHSEVLEALTEGSGPMGELLGAILAIEEGQVTPALAALGKIDLLQVQLDALAWSHEFCHSIHN